MEAARKFLRPYLPEKYLAKARQGWYSKLRKYLNIERTSDMEGWVWFGFSDEIADKEVEHFCSGFYFFVVVLKLLAPVIRVISMRDNLIYS